MLLFRYLEDIHLFKQVEIRSFEDVYSVGWLLNLWIFRGQGNSAWQLESKVERVSRQLGLAGPVDIERLAVNRFKREAQQFIHQCPNQENTVDWLALLQHHGGPTRLLDFTRSIYIALFFAIETSECEAAIWAINERMLFSNLDKKLQDESIGHDYTRAHTLISQRHVSTNIVDSGLLPTMPRWMSDRQSLQQGVFLYPENLRSIPRGVSNPENKRHINFQDNLLAEFNISKDLLQKPQIIRSIAELPHDRIHLDDVFLKIIIPNDAPLRQQLMYDLKAMNISARSLFPGIDGLARSYNFPPEAYMSYRMMNAEVKPHAFHGYFNQSATDETI